MAGRRAAARVVGAVACIGLLVGWVPAAGSPVEDDVTFLASDALAGRNNGTAGSAAARARLLDVLRPIAEGANPVGSGDAAYLQAFPGGTNVVAVIPGTRRPDEYVLVGAHYDHVGTSCHRPDPADTICNGATDNATGVAATLEIARRVAASPSGRSVVVAFWDREEDGLAGSQHYVKHPLVPLDATVAYVNFDIQGANLLPSLRRTTFAVGAETGGPWLQTLVGAAGRPSSLDLVRLSAVFGQYRSDYASFLGVSVPSVFFTDSSGPCYHTSQDEVDVVDFAKLDDQIDIAERLLRRLAGSAARPAFAVDRPLATYDDAVALLRVTERSQADRERFSEEDRAVMDRVRRDLRSIVTRAPKAPRVLSDAQRDLLFTAAVDAVEILTHGDCDGFLAAG